MAEVVVCEHIEAVTLGPNDRMAIVVPEHMDDDLIPGWKRQVDEWWPGRVVIVKEPLRIVAMTDGDDINTEAVNQ